MNKRLPWVLAAALIFTILQIVANETVMLRFLNFPAILLALLYFSGQWRNSMYLLIFIVTVGQAFLMGINLGVYLIAASLALILMYSAGRFKLDQFPYGHYLWATLGVLGYIVLSVTITNWPALPSQWGYYVATAITSVVLGRLVRIWFGNAEVEYTVKV